MNRKHYSQFWKDIGESDPYFGVLTHPIYRADQLDEAAKETFFESGRKEVDRIVGLFGKIPPFRTLSPQNALDFGCGTGRLSLALSPHCKQVTGLDISPAMIAEAKLNKKAKGIENVNFKLIDSKPPFLDESYDYIHSAMVFQHIHPKDGLLILDHLLSHLSAKGRAFIQITYNNLSSPKNKFAQYLNFTYPFFRRLFGRTKDYAFPMFDYDINEVFSLLQKHNVKRSYNIFGQSGPHQFVKLYIEKRA